MMKIAVVGGRDFTDRERLFTELDRARKLWGDFVVVSGGARGADQFAEGWAHARMLETEVYLPDYTKYSGYAAPLIRNETIAQVCDRMIAYWDGKSRGTKDSIDRALLLGKRVHIRSY